MDTVIERPNAGPRRSAAQRSSSGAPRNCRTSAGRVGALLATTGAGLIWRSARHRHAGGLGGAHAERSSRRRSRLTVRPRTCTHSGAISSGCRRSCRNSRSVENVGQRRSHWVASAPARWRTEWYADIINDIPNELIAWRTVEGSDVVSAGSVHFEPGPVGRGTVVRDQAAVRPAGRQAGRTRSRGCLATNHRQVIREGLAPLQAADGDRRNPHHRRTTARAAR